MCGRFEGPKYDKAVEAGVPTVSLAWLEACAAAGALQDCSLYIQNNSSTRATAAGGASDVLRDALVHVFSGAGEGGRASPGALEARRRAVRLGAQIAESVCFGVTHCVHVGEAPPGEDVGAEVEARNAVQREAEAAEGVGAYFVSAEWLALCEQKGERVDETPFVVQNPLKHVCVLSQKINDDNNNNNGDNNMDSNQNQQINARMGGLQSPSKALSTPLGVIGLRPGGSNLGGNGDGRGNSGLALFFPTQPQRTYSRKRGSGGSSVGGANSVGGKRSNPANAVMNQFESPGYLFRQNEQLLNELNSPNLNSNSNSHSNSHSNSNLSPNLNQVRMGDNSNETNGNENANESGNADDGGGGGGGSKKGGDDAVLLECLSGLRGLQAREGGADNGSEALPITQSGNKHRHARRSGNERKTHRTRLLVDPFSDTSSAAAAATSTLAATSAGSPLTAGMGMGMGMGIASGGANASYGDSEMMGLNGNGNGGIVEGDNSGGNGNGGDSGNESEELFDNPSQIIAYAPDADQRKREDLRRRLQNSK